MTAVSDASPAPPKTSVDSVRLSEPPVQRPRHAPGFNRRIYQSPAAFIGELWRVLVHWRVVLALAMRPRISAGLRERIMVVVTGVNRCRHCAYGHEFLAALAGVPKAEIAALLAQDFGHSPDDEIPALLFAMHWAESDACPTPEARASLVARYGEDCATQIEVAALLITAGNRFGNTFDYLLSRISGGRFGLLASERLG